MSSKRTSVASKMTWSWPLVLCQVRLAVVAAGLPMSLTWRSGITCQVDKDWALHIFFGENGNARHMSIFGRRILQFWLGGPSIPKTGLSGPKHGEVGTPKPCRLAALPFDTGLPAMAIAIIIIIAMAVNHCSPPRNRWVLRSVNLCESHVEVDPSGAPHVGGRMHKFAGSIGATMVVKPRWSGCDVGLSQRCFVFPYSHAYTFHRCILVHKSRFTKKKYQFPPIGSPRFSIKTSISQTSIYRWFSH